MLPPGGAELDIAILFADVRGSTQLGERLGPAEYASLLNRFYKAATETLIRHDAIIDKLIGDAVMALFIPGFCGPNYTRRAAEARFGAVPCARLSKRGNTLDANRRGGQLRYLLCRKRGQRGDSRFHSSG